jgi:hypothetical protein
MGGGPSRPAFGTQVSPVPPHLHRPARVVLADDVDTVHDGRSVTAPGARYGAWLSVTASASRGGSHRVTASPTDTAPLGCPVNGFAAIPAERPVEAGVAADTPSGDRTYHYWTEVREWSPSC